VFATGHHVYGSSADGPPKPQALEEMMKKSFKKKTAESSMM
jgi:hypothetical protein